MKKLFILIILIILIGLVISSLVLWNFWKHRFDGFCGTSNLPDIVINKPAQYLINAELQFDGEIQRENILNAFNDILNLSAEELKQRMYKNYTGEENQWDLRTLIYRHFVPEFPQLTLGDNFLQDIKATEAQRQVEQIIEIIENSYSWASFKILEKTVWPPIITYSELIGNCENIDWVSGPQLRGGKSYYQFIEEHSKLYKLREDKEGYCELIIEEGVQDGLYMTYNYSFPGDEQALNMGFTLKVQTCGGLIGDAILECEKESNNFDPLSLIIDYVPNTYR